MGKYTVIADVSEQLQDILRKGLVPELVQDQNGIGLCSPDDREDVSIGIFLYDIQESEEVRRMQMVDINEKSQQYPPMYLSLYYMVTAYSQSDKKFRTKQAERMLGRVIQCFHDTPYIQVGDEDVQLHLMRLSVEDKIKLWNFQKTPYTLSVFYKAAAVPVESAVVREVNRVRSAKMDVSHRERIEARRCGNE